MKLALIGTGKIIADALFALQSVETIERQAIFARPHSRAKGEALAAQYGIAEVYTDYAALLAQADIDTVYIGLVNNAHFSYGRQALEAGKNVIMEKPFTGTLAEAQELVALARERGLYVFEAITVLHTPVFQRMREGLPRLGRVRMLLGNYSQYSSRYDAYLAGEVSHAFDAAYLGGALRDINVYNIHYAAALFGVPRAVHYYPNRGFNGIDTSGTLVLEYDGFSAVCTGAKDSDSPCYLSVQGEKGWMRIDGKPNVAPNLTLSYVREGGTGGGTRDAAGAVVREMETETFVPEEKEHRMVQEFRDFARIIDTDDRAEAERLAEETLAVMQIVETALQA